MKTTKLKIPKPRKLTKHELMVTSIEQQTAHHHSARLDSMRRIAQFEVDELDNEIVALRAAIAVATERRVTRMAVIEGVTRTRGKRS